VHKKLQSTYFFTADAHRVKLPCVLKSDDGYTYTAKWRHSNLWSHYDLYAVRQRGISQLRQDKSGENLSRYSYKNENVSIITVLL